jgi:hypothetical protein
MVYNIIMNRIKLLEHIPELQRDLINQIYPKYKIQSMPLLFPVLMEHSGVYWFIVEKIQ